MIAPHTTPATHPAGLRPTPEPATIPATTVSSSSCTIIPGATVAALVLIGAVYVRPPREVRRNVSAMKQDERAPFARALVRARVSAYPPGEFVGQESFMTAGEIRSLATQARITAGGSVLDLCCGVAGPGRLITRELGCSYLGIDFSSSAIDIARESVGDLPCRFEVARIPPIPFGRFDVVLLFETMLAFPDKAALLQEV